MGFEHVNKGRWWDTHLKQHQLEKQVVLELCHHLPVAVYSSASVLGWLGGDLSNARTQGHLSCMHTSIPMQASGRGTELQSSVVSGGHFPRQSLGGKAERVVSVTLHKSRGLRSLVGVGDMQGRESGRLDRDRDV